jgi:hypothetical protein
MSTSASGFNANFAHPVPKNDEGAVVAASSGSP